MAGDAEAYAAGLLTLIGTLFLVAGFHPSYRAVVDELQLVGTLFVVAGLLVTFYGPASRFIENNSQWGIAGAIAAVLIGGSLLFRREEVIRLIGRIDRRLGAPASLLEAELDEDDGEARRSAGQGAEDDHPAE